LVTKGLVKLATTTTNDLDRLPRYDVPEDASPLDLLIEAREDEDR